MISPRHWQSRVTTGHTAPRRLARHEERCGGAMIAAFTGAVTALQRIVRAPIRHAPDRNRTRRHAGGEIYLHV